MSGVNVQKEQTPEQRLFASIGCCDYKDAQLALNTGAEVNAVHGKHTPLQRCFFKIGVAKGKLDRDEITHEQFINVCDKLVQIINDLLDMPGVDVYSKARAYLSCAAKFGLIDVIGKLLEKGVDVNICDDKKRTALYHAALHNQLAAATFLLEKGARVRLDLSREEKLALATPLSVALKYEHIDMVELLLVQSSIQAGGYIYFTAVEETFFEKFVQKHGDKTITFPSASQQAVGKNSCPVLEQMCTEDGEAAMATTTKVTKDGAGFF